MSNLLESKALKDALAIINKKYSSANIQIGSTVQKVDVIRFGLPSLDVAVGCGGIPLGRIVEIYGAESSGKTSLTLQLIASCQKQGHIAAFIDAEHALDPTWAAKIGVDMNSLLLSQPSSGEEAFFITEALVKSDVCRLIVIDSVAALTPLKELQGDMDGPAQIGAQARMMSQGLRKLVAVTSNSNCAIVFINQLREKIGVMFGNPETTPGGRSLKFYASIRIETKRGLSYAKGDHKFGIVSKVKIPKNKIAPPFKEAELGIYFGLPQQASFEECPVVISGYDVVDSTINAGKETGVITTRGSHYWYGEQHIANGSVATASILRDNQDLLQAITEAIYAELDKRYVITVDRLDSETEDMIDSVEE